MGPGPSPSRWARIGLAAAGAFVALAAAAWLGGVSATERRLYEAIIGALPDEHSHLFFWLSRLGSWSRLLPVAVFLIVLMPRPLLRRWWLWLAAILLVLFLEGVGKSLLGRGRPESVRAGFPSGHTAAATIFYLVGAYFAASVASRRGRRLVYATVGAVALLVGLARIVRHAHWPLDVAGGVTLGVAVFAAAAWWHERHPVAEPAAPSVVLEALRRWVHQWQIVIPIPFFAIVAVSEPMAAEDWALDLLFDGTGAALVLAGLWLRLWASGHAERRAPFPKVPPTRIATTGPYAYMRHPLLLANALISVGLVVLCESGPGLVLIPAVLIVVYRAAAAVEEASLAARHGAAYADYCARVPRLPQPTRALFAAAALRWAVIREELPMVTGVLLVAVFADAYEHLLRLLR